MRLIRPAAVALAALLAAASSNMAGAETAADFYKGKTVTLIAGFPPGGGYDTYVRVLARHYGKLGNEFWSWGPEQKP